MSKKWHSGPPPSIGWWPASMWRDPGVLRWWNGRSWSRGASKDCGPPIAATFAAAVEDDDWTRLIEWTDRPKSWPARSKT